MYERLDAIALGDQGFIMCIVACEIRKDAGGTSKHVDVIGTEEADQHLQQVVQTLLETKRTMIHWR